jgi:HD-like signal output (HDOD) protein
MMRTLFGDDQSPAADRLRERLDQPAFHDRFGSVDGLPSPPATLLDLNRVLARSDYDVDDVAAVIGRDVSTAAQLLQLVNSAFFGLAQPVSDLRMAVNFVGIAGVRNLVVAVEALSCFDDRSPLVREALAEVSDHANTVAMIARSLVPPRRGAASDVYTGALLHDIGLLLLAETLVDEMSETLLARAWSARLGLPPGRSGEEFEREAFGMTHAEAGAYLLGAWGLPAAVAGIVMHHHDAHTLPNPTLDAVHATHVADHLVLERATSTLAWEEATEPLDPDYVEALGLTGAITSLQDGADLAA